MLGTGLTSPLAQSKRPFNCLLASFQRRAAQQVTIRSKSLSLNTCNSLRLGVDINHPPSISMASSSTAIVRPTSSFHIIPLPFRPLAALKYPATLQDDQLMIPGRSLTWLYVRLSLVFPLMAMCRRVCIRNEVSRHVYISSSLKRSLPCPLFFDNRYLTFLMPRNGDVAWKGGTLNS